MLAYLVNQLILFRKPCDALSQWQLVYVRDDNNIIYVVKQLTFALAVYQNSVAY